MQQDAKQPTTPPTHPQVRTGYVTVDGLRIHYREAGAGPVLLLLHGWPTHSGLYREMIPRLAAHRRVVAIDLPGAGRSDKPINVRYSFSFYESVLSGFLNAVGVDEDGPVGLVVHDLGGPVGLHWAASNPGRLSELAVLNTLVFPELHWTVKAFVAALSLPGLRGLATRPAAVRATLRFGVNDRSRITDEVARSYSDVYQTRQARRALQKAGSELSAKGFARLERLLAQVEAQHTPTALIYGARDRVLPDVARTMRRLQDRWPHASSTALPDVGHFLQEDAPERVNAALLAFVGR